MLGQRAAQGAVQVVAGAQQRVDACAQLLGTRHRLRRVLHEQAPLRLRVVALADAHEALLLRRGQRLLLGQRGDQALGLDQPALLGAQHEQVLGMEGAVVVRRAVAALHRRPFLGQQRLRLGKPAQPGVGHGELLAGGDGALVVGPVARAQARQQGFEQRRRRAAVGQRGVQARQADQGLLGGLGFLAPLAPRGVEALLGQRDGDVEAVHAQVGGDQRGQHAVLDGGLVREALRQLGAPAFQQLDDAGRPAAMAVRAGRLQQLGHVVADGLGVARRLLRQRALVQRQRQAAAQRRQHQRGGQRQCPVAAQPQPGAVLPVLAPHADRLRRQVALQVLDEGADAGVALAGLLAQRLGAHRLQVAQRGRRVGRSAAAFAAFGQAQQLGEARRLAVQHGVLELGARQLAGALRQKAGEQLEQHDAQRVLVGAGADGLAGHLLGCRVGRRQARAGPGGQLTVGPRGVGVEQGGDAEVEQLGGTVRADDDVGGLEVAVHHQLRVRRLHGLRHVHQQAHASGHRQLPLAHMRRQGLAGHELQHQVGAVAGRRRQRRAAAPRRGGAGGRAVVARARSAGAAPHYRARHAAA